jgi:glycosyltransferase involved in cell wall biosynthesis
MVHQAHDAWSAAAKGRSMELGPVPGLDNPLLSVIVPALVADRELRRCLDSLHLALGDGPEWELILVMPVDVAADAKRLHPDVTICPERRRGIYGAMNDGAKASRGQYLYFLGKDDIALPALRSTLEVIRTRRPSVIFGDVYWGASGVYSGRPSRVRLLWRNACHQGIIYSRSSFYRHGPYLRKLKGQADHYINLRLLWSEEGRRAAYLPAPVAWYSGTGYSSTTGDPVFRRLYPLILRKHVGLWASCALQIYRLARWKLR